jgi:hypothetical protein
MKKTVIALAAAGVLAVAATAYADVEFNADTGTGFVGKGDVQLALGWNNKQLQDGASSAVFTYEASTVTATTWTCDRDGGTQTQERANTTTTTTQGVVSAVSRERNQINGFILNGFDGAPTTTSETDGPKVGSCPTGWTAIDLVEGEPQVVAGGLYVNGVALQ